MKGRHRIIIQNNKVHYDFEVVRNITIIRGDSATGKTTLIDMIAQYEVDKGRSGINLSCDKNCTVLTGLRWQENLSAIRDSIVFIDEHDRFITSKDFARRVSESDNYYVIVTRDNLSNLPYSVDEIYGIHESGKYIDIKKTYNELFKIYTDFEVLDEEIEVVITEDSNSGFDFFDEVSSDKNVKCISAGSKSNIYSIIQKNCKNTNCLIIGDGAAFGNEMNRLMELLNVGYRFALFLPESFEWVILKSGLIDGNRVQDILKSPEQYIESSEYFSWERFFTALIIKETVGTYKKYTKDKLNKYYLNDREKSIILESMGIAGKYFK